MLVKQELKLWYKFVTGGMSYDGSDTFTQEVIVGFSSVDDSFFAVDFL